MKRTSSPNSSWTPGWPRRASSRRKSCPIFVSASSLRSPQKTLSTGRMRSEGWLITTESPYPPLTWKPFTTSSAPFLTMRSAITAYKSIRHSGLAIWEPRNGEKCCSGQRKNTRNFLRWWWTNPCPSTLLKCSTGAASGRGSCWR